MTRFVQLAQKKRNLIPDRPSFLGRFNFSREKLSIFIFLALIISSFAYLALINNVSTGGFELKSLEQQIATLKEQNKKLEIEATKLESMNMIAQATENMGLKPADQVEYLEVTAPVVALGR